LQNDPEHDAVVVRMATTTCFSGLRLFSESQQHRRSTTTNQGSQATAADPSTSDRLLWLKRVKEDPRRLADAPLDDAAFARELVRQQHDALWGAAAEERTREQELEERTRELWKQKLASGGYLYNAPAWLLKDRDFALYAVEKSTTALLWLEGAVLADREIVLKAMQSGCLYLNRASEELRGDPEVVRAAVQQGRWFQLKHAPAALRADRAFVLSLPSVALEHLSPELRADREVVLAAMRCGSGGSTLHAASEELKADREVVLAAVRGSDAALEHASPQLRADRELVLASVDAHGTSLKGAAPELRDDRHVVFRAVASDPRALQHASARLRGDADFVREAAAHLVLRNDEAAKRAFGGSGG
jgi:hypothetical protein